MAHAIAFFMRGYPRQLFCGQPCLCYDRAMLIRTACHDDLIRVQAIADAAYQLYTNVVMTKPIGWYQSLGFQETGRRTENGYRPVYFAKEIR